MSFTDLKITELRKIADQFGVESSAAKTKNELVALLEEEGVTYQMYAKFDNSEKQDIEVPEVEKKKREKLSKNENTILVRMVRGNYSYQAMGYTFSQEHPFVAMPESDAQRLFDTQEGFRIATPREAQEYYN